MFHHCPILVKHMRVDLEGVTINTSLMVRVNEVNQLTLEDAIYCGQWDL